MIYLIVLSIFLFIMWLITVYYLSRAENELEKLKERLRYMNIQYTPSSSPSPSPSPSPEIEED